MKLRWEHKIGPNDPGARGCHMCPIVDFNGDGVEEVLWGERLIELDAGQEVFCADRDSYRGHSDIVQPFYDQTAQEWRIFTCREKDLKAKPRIVTYNQHGRRIWGDLESGHIDKGWVAHLHNPREFVAMGLRIQSKTAGPGGMVRSGTEAFCYDANTGAPLDSIPESSRSSLPVDLNGDGVHELVFESSDQTTGVIDGSGKHQAELVGQVAFVGHLLNAAGEHVVTFDTDGTVRIYRDANAVDSDIALKRYSHPFYRANICLSACGYNLINLGGL